MTFRARVKPNSTLWRRWMAESRIGGQISDVYFERAGGDFYSGVLEPDKVAELSLNNMVQLEMVTEPVGVVEPAEMAKVIPPKPEPQAQPKLNDALKQQFSAPRPLVPPRHGKR